MKTFLLFIFVSTSFFSKAQIELPISLTYEEAHFDETNDPLESIQDLKTENPALYAEMKKDIESQDKAIMRYNRNVYFFNDTIVYKIGGSRIMELPKEKGSFSTKTKKGVESDKVNKKDFPHDFTYKIDRSKDQRRIVNGIEGYCIVLTLDYTYDDGRKEQVEHTMIVSDEWNVPLNYYPFFSVDDLEFGNGLILECISIASSLPSYTTVQRLVDSSKPALAGTALETFEKLKDLEK